MFRCDQCDNAITPGEACPFCGASAGSQAPLPGEVSAFEQWWAGKPVAQRVQLHKPASEYAEEAWMASAATERAACAREVREGIEPALAPLLAALSGKEERYRHDGFVRWGLVERDIRNNFESLAARIEEHGKE